MKKTWKRSTSFVILLLVYVLATACGILCYCCLPISAVWLKLLVADVIATVFTFLFSIIFSNASVYDPYWSVQPPVILTYAAIVDGFHGAAAILAFIAVWYWGVRLTANWAYTFHGLDHQDWRYTMLKEKTGKFYPLINFVGIHLVPTLVVYACTLPAVLLFTQAELAVNAFVVIGFVLSLCAATMQGIADIQMHRYRKSGVKGFIRNGLWKYSRHPNYLGEILMWWGIALLSFGALLYTDFYWVCFLGAVLNTILFLCVSIPMADGRQSRKEGFAEYKKQTRTLLPLYKRSK